MDFVNIKHHSFYDARFKTIKKLDFPSFVEKNAA